MIYAVLTILIMGPVLLAESSLNMSTEWPELML